MTSEPIAKKIDRLHPGELLRSHLGSVFLVLGYEIDRFNAYGTYLLLGPGGVIDRVQLPIMRAFQWKLFQQDEAKGDKR